MSRPKRKLVVGDLIGRGNFAEVRQASDPIHGDVAVKILKRTAAETELEWRARKAAVVKEGRHLSDAAHERIVRVFYMKTAAGVPHLVMERCNGGSLLTRYEAGPIPLDDLSRIMTDVSVGVGVLHTRGMVHRDIKPSNILIDGRSGRAKVGDFGLVTDELVLGYASQAGYIDHLAKEVLEGAGTSSKTDIWALGMTAYRLLHGDFWHKNEVPNPRIAVPAGSFAKKLRWLPHIPKDWRSFIRKAMNDDPLRRFQTIEEMLNGLARLTVSPCWGCHVEHSVVRWSREKSGKRHEVIWNRVLGTSWEAVSIDLSSGKSRRLGSSDDLADLEDFFTGAK